MVFGVPSSLQANQIVYWIYLQMNVWMIHVQLDYGGAMGTIISNGEYLEIKSFLVILQLWFKILTKILLEYMAQIMRMQNGTSLQ